jgi:hypothetical protein
MKQTAVEWLIEMLYSPVCKGFIEGRTQIPFHIIEQAKAMEKEHIGRAYQEGLIDGMNHTPKDYYNKTYGGEDKS